MRTHRPRTIRMPYDDDQMRRTARALAAESLARGDALGWFEELYRSANGDPSVISWADLVPNPSLTEWLDRWYADGDGKKALVVGCGLGDDAEDLAKRGFRVTAFDISPTAVEWCRKRFPFSAVNYVVEDLLEPPASWFSKFDLVHEAYTLQVLPEELRFPAMARMAESLSHHGELVFVCRGRTGSDDPGRMPWPLLRPEVDRFIDLGLEELAFEDFIDDELPPARRFRARYRRTR